VHLRHDHPLHAEAARDLDGAPQIVGVGLTDARVRVQRGCRWPWPSRSPTRRSAPLLATEEARLLGETEPAACVTMERLVYDDTGRLVELGRHLYARRSTPYSPRS
jgi:hypothetical protein